MNFITMNDNCPDRNSPAFVATALLRYCHSQNWTGYDPYDGLNSKIFQAFRFLHFKYPRLAFIQMMKRSPINLRSLLLVPKTQNPKGIALFLTAIIKLYNLGLVHNDELIDTLSKKLLSLASLNDGCRAGWGYNFDWQARTGFEPLGTPNIICTTFAGNALLDTYKHKPEPYLLKTAIDAAHYIKEHLYVEINESEAFFDYTPGDQKKIIPIHNANLLGAAFLARIVRETGQEDMLPKIIKAARFSAKCQHGDGSWDYGECDWPSQRWIDNFHTGFNLCAFRCIGQDIGTSEFESNIIKGLDFYQRHFFSINGMPYYYHDRRYPIDIHSSAQSIITLATLKDLGEDNIKLANTVFDWTVSNMWNARGYFYFQKHPWWTIRIPYMRWNQAWMLLALATLEERRL